MSVTNNVTLSLAWRLGLKRTVSDKNTLYEPVERDLNKTIGENIRKYRVGKNLSQKNMAEFFRMSQSNYAKYERGETKFGLEFVMTLVDYLGLTLNDLTQGSIGMLMEGPAPYHTLKKNKCSLVIELDGTFRAEEQAINMVRQISQTLKATI